MPRLFFDLYDERTTSHDTNGILCADERTVSTTANRILAEIAVDEPMRAAQAKLFATGRDEAGRVVYTAALNITGSWLRIPINAQAASPFD